MIIYVRDNVILRSLAKGDAPASFRVIDANRDYLRKWLPWVDDTKSQGDTEKVFADWDEKYKQKSDYVFGIFVDGGYIGNMGLHDINRHNNSAIIGYWLSKEMQGRGIMTDCVRALTNFGLHTVGLNRINIHCAIENKKSRAIPERLGYVQEGIIQDGERLYGIFQDMALYAMVKRNWNNKGALSLILPSPDHEDAAMGFKREFMENGERWIHGSGSLAEHDDYVEWLEKVTNDRFTAREGRVLSSTYFCFADDILAGTIQIRHTLNDELSHSGGHIGYGVRPSCRRKGYGAKMLGLALAQCPVLGIGRALVTCNKDNIGSAKTILKNGGILENEITEPNGNIVQRYWINT